MTDREALLGREGPRRRLVELVGLAAGGNRSLALVSGPAGIGKSSLVRSVVADAEVLGWGTCVEAAAAPGYWPWSRALDAVAACVGARAAADAAGDDAPFLALIGRSFGPAAPSEGSERDRLLLMDAVSRWMLRVAAQRGPVVIVLDDLQWADESSLALVDFVARDPAPGAIAVIGCYRHDELAAPARRLLSHLAMSAACIELEGLDRAAVEALATDIAGPLSATAVDDLYRRAGGHPVFTRELARLARDGRIGRRLPVAVRDAIEHRLAELPDATRDVLEVAAIAGNKIELDVVAAAATRSQADIDDALDAARLAGIVTVDDAERLQFANGVGAALRRRTRLRPIRGTHSVQQCPRICAPTGRRGDRHDESIRDLFDVG